MFSRSMLAAVFLTSLVLSAEPTHAQNPRRLSVPFPVLSVQFTPTGDTLVCLGTELGRMNGRALGIMSAVQVIDLKTNKVPFEVRPSSTLGMANRSFTSAGFHEGLAVAPDGKEIAWVAANGTQLVSILGPNNEIRNIPKGATGPASSIVFTPDQKNIVVGQWNGRATVFDRTTGKIERTLSTKLSAASTIAIDPNGEFLACANRGDDVSLVNLQTGKVLRTWKQGGDKTKRRLRGVYPRLVFSPDGRVLATVGTGPVILWDVQNGEIVQRIGESISAVSFSPDGRTLALAEKPNGTIRLWDLAQQQFIAELDGSRSVQTLAFSPSGKQLAFAGAAKAAREAFVWDLESVLPKERFVRTVTPKELERLWTNLQGGNGTAAAYGAMWRLVGSPKQALTILKDRLKPAKTSGRVDPKRIAKWIKDLDSQRFKTRAVASANLAKQDRSVLPLVEAALEKAPSQEARDRLSKLAEKLRTQKRSPAELRAIFGVQTLENIGTQQAKVLLQQLARGVEESPLTQEAKKALKRWDTK
ncbi:MAG: WD40 repeat domain-containing protein [Gemmataceae bacterium]